MFCVNLAKFEPEESYEIGGIVSVSAKNTAQTEISFTTYLETQLSHTDTLQHEKESVK